MACLHNSAMRTVFLLIALLLAGPAFAEGPARVASLNVCADQLLMTLAPERIASLSPLARDPRLSFLAREAQAYPTNSGRGETMILERPDLVLAGPYDGLARFNFLREQGLEVMVVDPWVSIEQGDAQIRELAARLGASARGEELIARIEAALARTKDAVPNRPTVLALQKRGYVLGETSLMSQLMRHVGLEPYQAQLGLKDGGFVRLEQVVANPPDYLLLSRGDAQAIDQGSALLTHPALAATIPPDRRLIVDSRLFTCGGLSLIEGLDALAREARARIR